MERKDTYILLTFALLWWRRPVASPAIALIVLLALLALLALSMTPN
jgi:hypothetical protein